MEYTGPKGPFGYKVSSDIKNLLQEKSPVVFKLLHEKTKENKMTKIYDQFRANTALRTDVLYRERRILAVEQKYCKQQLTNILLFFLCLLLHSSHCSLCSLLHCSLCLLLHCSLCSLLHCSLCSLLRSLLCLLLCYFDFIV
jgi:hypothetical protein